MNMAKTAVTVPCFPPPFPFFSQAVVHNGMVYCSGNLGIDPATKKLVPGIAGQTERCLRNLAAVLETAGSSLENAVKVNIFITSMANFGPMNDVYAQFFNTDVKPCRTCVAVKELPGGADIEIECTAFVSKAESKL